MTTNSIAVREGELEEFETAYVPTQVVPLRWSIEKYKVAQMFALEGKTKNAIAKELGVPITAINTWLQNPEFQEYITKTVMDGAQALKAKKLQLLMKTLHAREQEAELEGYSSFSRKDSLEIIAEIRKEQGLDRTEDSNYTALLEKLVTNSMKQPKTIVLTEDI